jgi:long-chain acyl-CoA synthetase
MICCAKQRERLLALEKHRIFSVSMQNYMLSTLGMDLHSKISIPQVFFRTAGSYGERDALFEKVNGSFQGATYQELRQKALHLAAALIAYGLAPGENIALFSRNRIAWAVADLGILSAAAVNVPIYDTLSGSQVEHILAEADVHLIFVENKEKLLQVQEIAASLHRLKYYVVFDPTDVDLTDRVISLANFMQRGAQFHAQNPLAVENRYKMIDRDDVASIVYTCGTTGKPKGVMLTHKNFISNVYSVMALTDVSIFDRFLSVLPLCHVLERTVTHYTALFIGASIYYAENIKAVAQDLLLVKPTICVGVPRIFEKVYASVQTSLAEASPLSRRVFAWALDVGGRVFAVRKGHDHDKRVRHRPEQNLSYWRDPLVWHEALQEKIAHFLVYRKIHAKLGGKIRFFISGGAPLNAAITHFFRCLGVFIYEGYGLTETTPIVCFNFHGNYEAGTVGRLLPYVDVKFSDRGEIFVKGPNVMKGYYKNPAATVAVLDSEGWLRTGDVGCFTARNNLKVTGRIKEILITSGGKNVAMGPIEAALNQHQLITQSVVLGDKQPFVSCLIFPDLVALKELAAKKSLSYDSLDDLCSCDEIMAEYQKIIDEVNRPMPGYERIKKFKLVPCELSIASGELTPTLKLRRMEVMAKFAALAQEIYATKLAAE